MNEIIGTTIRLTKGDTFVRTISLRRLADNEEYTPVEGDVIHFALKRNVLNVSMTGYIGDEPLIVKEIPIDTMVLRINAEDTKSLAVGDYVYDIEVTFADGDVDTPINCGIFTLLPEVY